MNSTMHNLHNFHNKISGVRHFHIAACLVKLWHNLPGHGNAQNVLNRSMWWGVRKKKEIHISRYWAYFLRNYCATKTCLWIFYLKVKHYTLYIFIPKSCNTIFYQRKALSLLLYHMQQTGTYQTCNNYNNFAAL